MNEDLKEKALINLRRGAREVFEHEPRELFLSINGDNKEARKIERNLTNFSVELDEAPEFIEIFSEQDVRLAFLNFADEAPDQLTFNFSEDRKLLLNLKRESSKIIFDAVYEDPYFDQRAISAPGLAEDKSLAEFLAEEKAETVPLFGALLDSRQKKKRSFWNALKNSLVPSFGGFQTAVAGGSLAALVIAAILVAKLFIFVPQVSANEIIQKIATLEEQSENDTEKVLYRVLNFEEIAEDGTILKKRRIEFINDAARKLSVRRLFDENNRLLAGEWRRKDGVSTLYAVGKMSELRLVQADNDIITKDLENIWQISVSAKGFGAIVGALENATVEEQADNAYRINFTPKAESPITKAALIVNRDWRINKMSLTVNQQGAAHEFSFTEAAFEQKPRASVEKTAFEPNSEFLKSTLAAGKNNAETERAGKPSDETETKDAAPAETTSAPDTAELEVKILQLLNGVNGLSGEQISIVKTPAGKIQVKGVVDAKSRRDEILNALAEVRSNPSVSVNIQTAEEAAKNKPSKNPAGTLESISVESRNSIPAADTLRNHFAARGLSDEKIETEIRRFASAALAKSSQVRRSALQMKQIAERFSPAQLEKMDEATRADWRRLIKQNAAVLAQNSDSLRGDLQSALGLGTAGGGSVNAASDADLIRAARRLFELSLAVDRDVRASFSSGAGGGNVPAKSAAFANNLGEIINLARELR
ncbi:MAG TPA: hypothetical protein VGC97_05365 [Pyrinomonadaceae bacterium]|jgi:hypothetical protein